MGMIRCGLVGYGAWGWHHARVIAASPHAQLVAIAARTEETRAKARHDYPACRIVSDYRELLAESDLGAVVVVLPSHLHYEVARAAVESDCHLLLEKPMCLATWECEELIALARARGRVLAVGHEMRLSTLWGKAKELIAAGALGEPLYALMELWRRPYRAGADGWRYDLGRVGSWILEEPIHFFDLARWYFQGRAKPVSVYARANAKNAGAPELQDHFSALVEFSGGRYAVISQALGGWEHHQTVKVSGTDGALWAAWSGAMDRTTSPAFSLKLQRGGALEAVPIPHVAGEVFELEAQFARFALAIQTGVPAAATGEDGAWSVRMCVTAQESVRLGQPVNF
jgi:myo-inositol 2-dehydrogenase/D-chiro-inositol 1-dehydrogenase